MISQYIRQRRYVDRCLLEGLLANNMAEVCLASHRIKNACSNTDTANIPRISLRSYLPPCSISRGPVCHCPVFGTSLKDYNVLFSSSVCSTANVCFMPRYLSMAHLSKCFCADIGACCCYSLGRRPDCCVFIIQTITTTEGKSIWA